MESRGRRISMRAKIAVTATLITTLGVGTLIVYSTIHCFRAAEENGLSMARVAAESAASQVSRRLSLAMSVATENANAILGLHRAGLRSREQINALLRGGLQAHPELLGLYTGWEAQAFDGRDAEFAGNSALGSSADGRFMPNLQWDDGRVDLQPLCNYDQPGFGDYYLIPKHSARAAVIVADRESMADETFMVASLVQPLLADGKFVGITGVDLGLRELQEALSTLRPFTVGHVALYSGTRQILSTPASERIGSQIDEAQLPSAVWDAVIAGSPQHFVDQSAVSRFLLPVPIVGSDAHWVIDVHIPRAAILADAVRARNGAILIGVIFIVLDALLVGWAVQRQIRPMHALRAAVDRLGSDLNVTVEQSGLPVHRGDEIGMLAQAIDSLRSRLADSLATLEHQVRERKEALSRSNAELQNRDTTRSSAASASTAEEQQAPLATTTTIAAPRTLHGASVLLVEDNAINQLVAGEFLHQLGVRVTTAGNGQQALDRLQSAAFDAVLMDLQMPVMDGFEAARAIRAQARWAGLPIIAMTAAVLQEDRDRCTAAGMNDFVAKPVDALELAATLSRHLGVAESPGGQASLAQRSASPPPAAASPQAPVQLDLVAAQARFVGNMALYRRLLRDFAAEFRDSPDRLQRCFASADGEGARRLIHTIKGAAANLSAVALAEACARFEREIRDGTDAEGLPRYQTALDTSLACIATELAEEVSSEAQVAPATAESPADLVRKLSELRSYLAQRELPPDDLLAAVSAAARQSDDSELLQRLVSQIDQFDHDGALHTLSQII